MDINGRTKITGLYGYPVEHTLSPSMHNAAFEHLGLNYCYLPFSVHPTALASAVDSIRALNMSGVNITVPHKETVIPLLDRIDEEASFIGAVNTVVNHKGSLTGYNTDGKGFMRSADEHGITFDNRNILIAGAGGAARAISYYLAGKASFVSFFDIDKNKLDKLISDLAQVRSTVAGLKRIENLNDYDILINATPLGLKQGDPLPFDIAQVTPAHTVIDLIYRETPLLEDASRKGCPLSDGSGMLLWQGALAFELWTGMDPPIEIMRNALFKHLT